MNILGEFDEVDLFDDDHFESIILDDLENDWT